VFWVRQLSKAKKKIPNSNYNPLLDRRRGGGSNWPLGRPSQATVTGRPEGIEEKNEFRHGKLHPRLKKKDGVIGVLKKRNSEQQNKGTGGKKGDSVKRPGGEHGTRVDRGFPGIGKTGRGRKQVQ